MLHFLILFFDFKQKLKDIIVFRECYQLTLIEPEMLFKVSIWHVFIYESQMIFFIAIPNEFNQVFVVDRCQEFGLHQQLN